MSASTLNSTTYNNVAANTVNNAVLDAAAILAWRQDVKAVVDQHATEINGKASKTLPAWTAPTLVNSWVNYGFGESEAGYYKDDMGIVRLRGLIKNGIITAGTVLFTLPAGYIPSQSEQRAGISYDGTYRPTAINVRSDGTVTIENAGNTWLSLNNVAFRAST